MLLYLESFGNPRRFGTLARRVARTKPILAVKSGTTSSGARAASSHTAALAGSEAAVDALFHQAGVIRASTLEELIDVATLLSTQPMPRGRRVAVLTNAGGLGILCADACEAAGLELPQLSEETVRAIAPLLPARGKPRQSRRHARLRVRQLVRERSAAPARRPAVDAVIVLFVPAVSATADAVADAVARVGRSRERRQAGARGRHERRGNPAAVAGSAVDVAAFGYPESAARALGRAAERADWLRRPLGSVPEVEGVDTDAALAVVERALGDADGRWLEPTEARELLLAYGVPLVPEQFAASADDATSAAATLGYPVVVKTAAAGAHKTETGGIALDLTDDEAVRAAVERIGAPVIVQPMVSGGAELLAGLVQDPVFGPLVAFGPGGVLAELIGQASFRIAPLTDVDAEELVSEGKAGVLVRGFRGAPAADAAALVDLVSGSRGSGSTCPPSRSSTSTRSWHFRSGVSPSTRAFAWHLSLPGSR